MHKADVAKKREYAVFKFPLWYEFITLFFLVVIVYSMRQIVIYQVDDIQNRQIIAFTKTMISYEPLARPSPTLDSSLNESSHLFIWSIDNLWNSLEDTEESKASVSATPTPSSVHMVPADTPQPRMSFDQLLEINPDTVGWLRIDGTHIDYPVVQAGDNQYYLRRNFLQKDNVNGSIFMDYRNKLDGTDRNIVVYGHNMKNRSMFADIIYYESWTFFVNHPKIQLVTIGIQGTWQVFSANYTDTSVDYIQTDFRDDHDFEQFIEMIRSESIHGSTLNVTKDDVILTLSTCSVGNETGRFTIHAKWIRP